MKRRNILLAGLGILGLSQFAMHAPLAARAKHAHGRLVIIGGAEDRKGDKLILRRFVELTMRDNPRIAVLTAASAFPDFAWYRYAQVLADIGVERQAYVELNSPEDCNDPMLAARIREADGVLITGGNQHRLLSLIGGTAVHLAIRQAYFEMGSCVAGTSAGAAAMSKHMLVGRSMSLGIGLIEGAIIDQHFTQRRRLARLAAAVADNPQLIGIGVDEDTAFILDKDRGFEVIGAGEVTIVDGHRLTAPLDDIDPEKLLERPEMQVHRLPAGTSYRLVGAKHVRAQAPGVLTLPEGHDASPTLQSLLPVLLRL